METELNLEDELPLSQNVLKGICLDIPITMTDE